MALVFVFCAGDQDDAVPEHIDPVEGNDHFLINLGDWSTGEHFAGVKISKCKPDDYDEAPENTPEDIFGRSEVQLFAGMNTEKNCGADAAGSNKGAQIMNIGVDVIWKNTDSKKPDAADNAKKP